MPDLEDQIRKAVAQFASVGADGFAMTDRLDNALGYTSMKMVLLITTLCKDTGVPLTAFTEKDLAEMMTPETIKSSFESKIKALEES